MTGGFHIDCFSLLIECLTGCKVRGAGICFVILPYYLYYTISLFGLDVMNSLLKFNRSYLSFSWARPQVQRKGARARQNTAISCMISAQMARGLREQGIPSCSFIPSLSPAAAPTSEGSSEAN